MLINNYEYSINNNREKTLRRSIKIWNAFIVIARPLVELNNTLECLSSWNLRQEVKVTDTWSKKVHLKVLTNRKLPTGSKLEEFRVLPAGGVNT